MIVRRELTRQLDHWQVELLNPEQFSQLGDLRLFVMYSYE